MKISSVKLPSLLVSMMIVIYLNFVIEDIHFTLSEGLKCGTEHVEI